jgi:tetratricopeptide (TPR) repeat protein
MTAATPTVTPTQTSNVPIACALVVFITSLVLYTWTLAPTVTLVDSGELIVAARSLGVAHPPGFPLYVLLAHLATLVPIGNVAIRVNFASALFAALASAVAALVVIEAMVTARFSVPAGIARKKANRSKRRKKLAAPQQRYEDPAPRSPFLLVVSCLVSGLLLAFSRTLWAYATIAEVYTLNLLLILVIFLLMFRWRRGFIEATGRQSDAGSLEEERKSALSPDAAATSENRLSSPRPVAPSPPRVVTRSPPHASLYAAAFCFGIALGVHHVTVGLMLPAFAVLVFATDDIGFFVSRRLVYAALFAFAGLFAVYAYLPLAASRSPIMNWGDPRTLERLWWHVTGKQYQVFFTFSLRTMAIQFFAFIKLAAREFGPWWLPAGPALAITGLGALFRRDKAMFWFLAVVIAADLAYSLGYDIAEDKDAYYLPAFIAMTIAAGFGLAAVFRRDKAAFWFLALFIAADLAHSLGYEVNEDKAVYELAAFVALTIAAGFCVEWLINKAISVRILSIVARPIAAALVLLAPIAAIGGNWPYDNRSRYFIAQDYVDNILSTIEPGGLLLTRDWQVYSPMLYFREIEHRRNDAVVIDVNQLRRSWYYDYLRRAYPATIEQASDQVEAFLEDLRHWEHDADLYQGDLMLNQRINSRFYEMILAFVTNHIRSAPVYVTLDIAGNRDGPDAELTKSLAGLYQFIPQGLVFQVTTDREFRQPADSQPITRGLADGTIKFDDDDVVKLKVLPVYVTMSYNRGRYLAANGRHEQAIEAFRQSLALNPRFSLAQQAVNESMNAMRKGAANKTQ